MGIEYPVWQQRWTGGRQWIALPDHVSPTTEDRPKRISVLSCPSNPRRDWTAFSSTRRWYRSGMVATTCISWMMSFRSSSDSINLGGENKTASLKGKKYYQHWGAKSNTTQEDRQSVKVSTTDQPRRTLIQTSYCHIISLRNRFPHYKNQSWIQISLQGSPFSCSHKLPFRGSQSTLQK